MDNTANLVQHGLIRHADGSFTTYRGSRSGHGTGPRYGVPRLLRRAQSVRSDRGDLHGLEQRVPRLPSHSDGNFASFNAPGAGKGSGQGTGCPSDCPVSLNNKGAITGVYIDAKNVYHVYLRNPEGNIVTVEPVGSTFAFPAGINDLGTLPAIMATPTACTMATCKLPASNE